MVALDAQLEIVWKAFATGVEKRSATRCKHFQRPHGGQDPVFRRKPEV